MQVHGLTELCVSEISCGFTSTRVHAHVYTLDKSDQVGLLLPATAERKYQQALQESGIGLQCVFNPFIPLGANFMMVIASTGN